MFQMRGCYAKEMIDQHGSANFADKEIVYFHVYLHIDFRQSQRFETLPQLYFTCYLYFYLSPYYITLVCSSLQDLLEYDHCLK